MTFIHELPNWPDFTWDLGALAAPLAAVRHAQGLHLGRMRSLGFEYRAEAGLEMLTTDVVKSWAIEGETIDADEVRSSIASRLGLDAGGIPRGDREVDGVVEMMLDATRNFLAPLTEERLFRWHAALFPTGRSGLSRITVGAWRPKDVGPMQVLSGPSGHEQLHFEAPAAERLGPEMAIFLDGFNAEAQLDPVLRAGIAHFWFVTIHPFEDGNGRIARAIGDMALARADGTEERFYSLSAQIEAERKQYYLELEGAQRGDLDITAWLRWFLGCLDRAVSAADRSLGHVLRKARVWERVNRHPVNERQRKVLNRLLDGFRGHLTSSKYARLARCSPDTALRDIRDLLEYGVLVQNPGGGRSTSYRLAEPDPMQA
ncbi:MAG: Fic family protein [Planctomycetota bacterium]|nr:MAG: Fic family protein [Planctomycetota bacterium]